MSGCLYGGSVDDQIARGYLETGVMVFLWRHKLS